MFATPRSAFAPLVIHNASAIEDAPLGTQLLLVVKVDDGSKTVTTGKLENCNGTVYVDFEAEVQGTILAWAELPSAYYLETLVSAPPLKQYDDAYKAAYAEARE